MTNAVSEAEVPSVAEELVRNGSRSSGRGRPWKDRTHCLRGHAYTAENIEWRSHGARRCKKCKAERGRVWYHERGGKEARQAAAAARRQARR
jgi:hypothetical protein